eukprot:967711-Pelagomonas_calceolata.AAC.1
MHAAPPKCKLSDPMCEETRVRFRQLYPDHARCRSDRHSDLTKVRHCNQDCYSQSWRLQYEPTP